MKQFLQLLLIQLKEFYREPAALFWSFVFPMLMSLGLGTAFSSNQKEETKRIAIVIENNDTTSTLGKFLFENTKIEIEKEENITVYSIRQKNYWGGVTDFRFFVTNIDNSLMLLKRSKVALIITDKKNETRYLFDAQNPEAKLLFMETSSLLKNKSVLTNNEQIEPLEKIGTRYIDFLIPGLITMGIMG